MSGSRYGAEVEIVVPTTAQPHRAESLQRAVDSVLGQAGVCASVILVANGPWADEALIAKLAGRERVSVIRERSAGAPHAQRVGREAVRAPFFGFLDDDDLLLPGALRTRLDVCRSEPDVDVVVTNGYRCGGSQEQRMFERFSENEGDPLVALLQHNWLASCGAVYRTRTVSPEFWDPEMRYLEWTAVAFRLAHAGKRMRFLEEPTFVINDTPDSLSKKLDYHVAAPAVWEQLLTLELPAEMEQRFRRKLGRLQHGAARALLRSGHRGRAWRHHWQSMRAPGGVALYWKFTLRLLLNYSEGA